MGLGYFSHREIDEGFESLDLAPCHRNLGANQPENDSTPREGITLAAVWNGRLLRSYSAERDVGHVEG